MMRLLVALGRYTRFCLAALRQLPWLDVRETLHQTHGMAIGSLTVMLAVGAFSGAMLTVQGSLSLRAFGTPELLGLFVALAGVREVFPIIGAGCVGAKVGSAVASEVSTMRIGQQLDALEVMAVDPMRYVMLPRMVACVVATPLLVAVCIFSGLLSSYLIATLQLGVDPGAFVARAMENIAVTDLVAGMCKSVTFGVVTGTLACFHGQKPAAGPASVGAAANVTVVQTTVVGAVLNLLISTAFYGAMQ